MSCSILAIGAGPRLCVLNGRIAILPTHELNSRICEWYAWIINVRSYQFLSSYFSAHPQQIESIKFTSFVDLLTGILNTGMFRVLLIKNVNDP